MGISYLNKYKLDKKFVLACIFSVLLAIICGIVLYICAGISIYTYNFADTYVFYILNFKNVNLFFAHLVVDIFYFYAFFFIGYFTKYKYLTCPILFLKWFFGITYVIILFTCFSIEGIIVAIVVFIPSFLISSIFCILSCDFSKYLKKSIAFFFGAVLAFISTTAMILLINVFFRVLIVIV